MELRQVSDRSDCGPKCQSIRYCMRVRIARLFRSVFFGGLFLAVLFRRSFVSQSLVNLVNLKHLTRPRSNTVGSCTSASTLYRTSTVLADGLAVTYLFWSSNRLRRLVGPIQLYICLHMSAKNGSKELCFSLNRRCTICAAAGTDSTVRIGASIDSTGQSHCLSSVYCLLAKVSCHSGTDRLFVRSRLLTKTWQRHRSGERAPHRRFAATQTPPPLSRACPKDAH
jgi:hypothetical protein